MSEEFQLKVAEALGRIEEKVDQLSGPNGRIAALENEQRRTWWLSVAIAPALATTHALLRKFGVNI